MPVWIFIIVVMVSFFHAWWNVRLKKMPINRSAFLIMSWLLFGVIATPVSLFFVDKQPEWDWLFFIIASGIAQALYLLALSWAYSISDISQVFPISRGTAVGLTTAVLFLMGASDVSLLGWVGVGAIVLGAMSMGHVDLKSSSGKKGLLASLAIAIIVCFYSVLDTFGAQKIPVIFYVIIMNITGSLFALPFIFRKRKSDIALAFKHYKWEGFWVGFAGSAVYLVILWTFQYATPAYVLALREVSIVFAVLLGWFSLKESISLSKVIGISFIVLGIVCIKLA